MFEWNDTVHSEFKGEFEKNGAISLFGGSPTGLIFVAGLVENYETPADADRVDDMEI